jgi:hypothetical protein
MEKDTTTADIPTALVIVGERRHNNMNRSARKALESLGASKCGRDTTSPARPYLWRLPDRG